MIVMFLREGSWEVQKNVDHLGSSKEYSVITLYFPGGE